MRNKKFLKFFLPLFFLFFCLFSLLYFNFLPARAQSAPITGLAVLGDSFSDEYRADNNRGGIYASTTFNWLELLQQNRGVNVGPWGTWGGSRRTGYEYNWSRSGARVHDVISGGQVTGVVSQIQQGLISHVVVHVGANDFALFNNTYKEIYDGTLTDAQVQQKIDTMVADFTTIIDSIKAAGATKIILANLGDRGLVSSFVQQFPDPIGRQRVTNTIKAINNGIQQLVTSRGIQLADQFNLGNLIFSQIDTNGNLIVGGEKISLVVDGDEPHHVLLGDHEHAGTVMSGVIDNLLYLPILNGAFQAGILPFTDAELLTNAGIIISVPTPSPIPSSGPSLTPTPTLTNTPSPSPTLSPSPSPSPSPTPTPTLTLTPSPTPSPSPSPTPGITEMQPFIYQLTYGSYQSGNVSSLFNDDNNYLRARSTTSGLTRTAQEDIGFNTLGLAGSIKSIAVTIRLRSSATSTNIKVYVYNFSINNWQQFASYSIGTSENLRTININSGFNNYVDSLGQFGVRIKATKSLSTFTLDNDQTSVRVTR